MKDFFKEIFEYNHHFNQKLWLALSENQSRTSLKSVELYNHILNAHQIWNYRIEPRQETIFGVWEIHDIQELKEIDILNYKHTLLILDTVDLNSVIDYTNSKSQKFENSIRDIFFHLINHSTYHRGQIASEFVKSGIKPLSTDYIFYKR
jgi:uncharacterized damage-inducible protein DinB